MRSLSLLPLALLACGDNKTGDVRPDGRQRIDASTEDASGVRCDYTEAGDATNDVRFGGGTAENTGLSFATTALGICGVINNGHFNSTEMNVDVDAYTITVPADTLVILHLRAPGADALESVSFEISGLTTATTVTGLGVLSGELAVISAKLAPGDYQILVSSKNATDAAEALDYTISLGLDVATRCSKSTAAVDHAESGDGTLESGNDIVEIRHTSAPARQFTLLGDDVPEATGITVAADSNYHVTGTTAFPVTAPVSWMDDYQDRDTYAITTGPTTNTLTIRVSWPGTTTDHDVYVFPMGSFEEISSGRRDLDMEDELVTVSVAPDTQYWITVAADDASEDAAVAYDMTLCGSAEM